MRLLASPIVIAFLVATAGASTAEETPWSHALAQAREHMQHERPADALDALGRAFHAGLDNVGLVLSDAVLLPLHGEPAFKALIRDNAGTRPIILVTPEEPGEPLEVKGEIHTDDGRVVAGALVHVFHADATGWYSRQGAMDEPHSRIFGYMRSDADGRFVFRTVRPGAYPERDGVEGPARFIPAHIHVEVETPGGLRKMQVVFSDDPRMQPEHWKTWAAKQGNPIVVPSRENGLWSCALPIRV